MPAQLKASAGIMRNTHQKVLQIVSKSATNFDINRENQAAYGGLELVKSVQN